MRQSAKRLDVGIKPGKNDDGALRAPWRPEDQTVKVALGVGNADTSFGCAWIGGLEEIEEFLVGDDTVGI